MNDFNSRRLAVQTERRAMLASLYERYGSPRNWVDRLRRWRDRWEDVDFATIAKPEDVGLDPTEAAQSAPSAA